MLSIWNLKGMAFLLWFLTHPSPQYCSFVDFCSGLVKAGTHARGNLLLKHALATHSWVILPCWYTWVSLLVQHPPATDLLQELAPSYLTSLIQWSKTREQNVCCATTFSHGIVGTHEGASPREHVAGACFRSKLPSVYRPLDSCWLWRVFLSVFKNVIESPFYAILISILFRSNAS